MASFVKRQGLLTKTENRNETEKATTRSSVDQDNDEIHTISVAGVFTSQLKESNELSARYRKHLCKTTSEMTLVSVPTTLYSNLTCRICEENFNSKQLYIEHVSKFHDIACQSLFIKTQVPDSTENDFMSKKAQSFSTNERLMQPSFISSNLPGLTEWKQSNNESEKCSENHYQKPKIQRSVSINEKAGSSQQNLKTSSPNSETNLQSDRPKRKCACANYSTFFKTDDSDDDNKVKASEDSDYSIDEDDYSSDDTIDNGYIRLDSDKGESFENRTQSTKMTKCSTTSEASEKVSVELPNMTKFHTTESLQGNKKQVEMFTAFEVVKPTTKEVSKVGIATLSKVKKVETSTKSKGTDSIVTPVESKESDNSRIMKISSSRKISPQVFNIRLPALQGTEKPVTSLRIKVPQSIIVFNNVSKSKMTEVSKATRYVSILPNSGNNKMTTQTTVSRTTVTLSVASMDANNLQVVPKRISGLSNICTEISHTVPEVGISNSTIMGKRDPTVTVVDSSKHTNLTLNSSLSNTSSHSQSELHRTTASHKVCNVKHASTSSDMAKSRKELKVKNASIVNGDPGSTSISFNPACNVFYSSNQEKSLLTNNFTNQSVTHSISDMSNTVDKSSENKLKPSLALENTSTRPAFFIGVPELTGKCINDQPMRQAVYTFLPSGKLCTNTNSSNKQVIVVNNEKNLTERKVSENSVMNVRNIEQNNSSTTQTSSIYSQSNSTPCIASKTVFPLENCGNNISKLFSYIYEIPQHQSVAPQVATSNTILEQTDIRTTTQRRSIMPKIPNMEVRTVSQINVCEVKDRNMPKVNLPCYALFTSSNHKRILTSSVPDINESVTLKTSIQPQTFKSHITTSQGMNTTPSCLQKGQATRARRNFRKYMTWIPGGKCTACNKPITNEKQLKAHRNSHREYNFLPLCWQCNFCSAQFRCKTTAVHHIRLHLDEGVLHCSCCSYKTTARDRLEDHYNAIHSKEKKYVCNICEKVFYRKTILSQHKKIHTRSDDNSQKVKCKLCDANVAKHKLKWHKETVHNASPVMCEICGKIFKSRKCYIAHNSRQHTECKERKPVECKLCGVKVKSLPLHMKTHEQRTFQCHVCGKSFLYRHHVINHMPVHTGIRPYVCQICGFGFLSPYHLKNHLRTKHNVTNYVAKWKSCKMIKE